MRGSSHDVLLVIVSPIATLWTGGATGRIRRQNGFDTLLRIAMKCSFADATDAANDRTNGSIALPFGGIGSSGPVQSPF
jgi:hypothetical protein